MKLRITTHPFILHRVKSRCLLASLVIWVLLALFARQLRDNSLFKRSIVQRDWCGEPLLEPLPYSFCTNDSVVYRVKLLRGSGMCSALIGVLEGAMYAFSQNACFFVDERDTLLRYQQDGTSFIQRYFEPIGSPEYLTWISGKQVEDITYAEKVTAFARSDRISIPSLGYIGVERYTLRKAMTRRLWRVLPHIRQAACSRLGTYLQLDMPFVALSIRRGDKHLEDIKSESTDTYISMAEKVVALKFNHRMPILFVASDDCSVLQELRAKRPNWKFVSECSQVITGFTLAELGTWNMEQLDDHFLKFFVELFAMAMADVWIGVPTTNVAHWVYYMRDSTLGDDSFFLINGSLVNIM